MGRGTPFRWRKGELAAAHWMLQYAFTPMSMNPQPVRVSSSETLVDKVKGRTARVGIIGLGYVGLPLALLFSEQKFPVTGFDIDQRKIDTLASGGTYIFRITPEE